MKSIVPYLAFDGNCRAAMTFYAKVLQAELDVTDASQMPNCPDANKEKVLHARLHSGAVVLMASDNLSDRETAMGNNVWVSVDCASIDEQQRYFSMLGEGGEIRMALQDTFWGAHFGMLTDASACTGCSIWTSHRDRSGAGAGTGSGVSSGQSHSTAHVRLRPIPHCFCASSREQCRIGGEDQRDLYGFVRQRCPDL